MGFASGGVKCKHGAFCFVSSTMLVDSFVLRKPKRKQSPKTFAVILNEKTTSTKRKHLDANTTTHVHNTLHNACKSTNAAVNCR